MSTVEAKKTQEEILAGVPKNKTQGDRVSGKPWKVEKKAFNISMKHKTKKLGFSERKQKQEQERLLKEKLQQLKDEKSTQVKERVETIKKRKEEKEEKERYERLAQKYHAKKVERMRRKEKRNKLLSDGKKK